MFQKSRERLLSLLLLSLLIFGVTGCRGGDDTGFDNLLTVATQGSVDRCEFLGRYNDQVCDTGCPLPDPDCDSGAIRNIDADGPTMCVALRGNGDRIPAHFAGLARITENYGLLSGVAGGSSAAFSAMLIESVQKTRPCVVSTALPVKKASVPPYYLNRCSVILIPSAPVKIFLRHSHMLHC